MRKTIGFVMTAGHLDIEWYQPMDSYRFWTIQAFEDLKKAAIRDDFKVYVLDGQVFPVEVYLESVPEDRTEILDLIQRGKLAIGPFYTQFDEWLPSAENMIRNCLYGKSKGTALGGWMRAGYLPDNFGHPLQLPQILQGFGIDSLMFMRGLPEIEEGHPDEFLYQGLDGSRVLVSHFRESYAGAFDIFSKDIKPKQPRPVPYYDDYISYEYHQELAFHDDPERIAKNLISNVRRIAKRYPSGVIPLIAGADHLPPQINVGESIKAANALQDDIEFIMGTAEDYVNLVKERSHQPAVYSMELLGSVYQFILLGALSTRSYLKRQNFACEALLERYAEPLSVLAHSRGFAVKPALLHEAWRKMLLNSAHDSIHGSSVDETHIDMESRYGSVRQLASGVIHDTLSFLGQTTRRTWSEQEEGVLVYAPVLSSFTQPVEVYLPVGDRSLSMYDQNGVCLPTQVLPRQSAKLNGIGLPRNDDFPDTQFRKILFLSDCKDAALGLAISGKQLQATNPLQCDDHSLENEYLRLDVKNGALSITDKLSGRKYHNLNLLEEEADAGDAWDFSPPWIPGETVHSFNNSYVTKLVENGPVRATLQLNGSMSVPACLEGDYRSARRVILPLRFEVSLYSGLRRVDIRLTMDNTARDHRIRLRVMTGIRTSSILSQGHLAILDRPVERPRETRPWRQPPTQLLPFREWVAAEDGEAGLAIAFKGMYDYQAITNPLTSEPDIAVTLLRGFDLMGRRHMMQRGGPASDAVYTPGAQCLGEQVFEWCYLPFTVQAEDKAPFLGLAQSFLYPPVSHAIRSNSDGQVGNPAHFPFGWDAKNIQFSAFKHAHDQDGYILRLYENQGKETKLALRIDRQYHVYTADMDEERLEMLSQNGEVYNVTFSPYKALTFKLVPKL